MSYKTSWKRRSLKLPKILNHALPLRNLTLNLNQNLDQNWDQIWDQNLYQIRKRNLNLHLTQMQNTSMK